MVGWPALPFGILCLFGAACGAEKDEISSGRLATFEISVHGNVDANAVPPPPFDPLAPADGSNHGHPLLVFDGLGGDVDLMLWFRKDAAGSWEWHALFDRRDGDDDLEVNTGALTFDTSGLLVDATEVFDNFSPVDGERQPLLLNFGRTLAEGGEGTTFTQLADASSVRFDQDGAAR